MLVKDVFAADVTRDIAPVVYFHEQKPEQVAKEVSEYIITGGYPETDPRYKNVKSVGIHEQFVKLLRSLAIELNKAQGTELPASWISGFYGSGKSSFAKLLGLALDGMVLPDGRLLYQALLARDDSPKAQEFQQAWEQVRSQINPVAVVFDIGAVARDDEQIHSAVKREIQKRLGYCTISHYVADFELKLEQDGEWERFLECVEETLGQPWSEAKNDKLAEEAFSEVMSVMFPNRYNDPLRWFESRAGSQTGAGTSVAETTKAIAEMLQLRAKGKTIFVVVDEVSQYIYQNNNRMLKLQSFVSDLGQKLKGQVWLLATGQQKLEDSDDESSIGKLKDRFPPKLRVHLAPTNIRDVVHKRLLKKAPGKESDLRSLFQQFRSDLKLYGYKCESITEEDFVEVYPMLPGYVDLLMQITSNLRTRSLKAKGDDHAIRGLLQLLGELFREQKLGEQPLGTLIRVDHIYEVLKSALDNDMQNTLTRIFNHEEVSNDPQAIQVAKAVSLLELIQEQEPTTAKLVSQCLYGQLGQGNQESVITAALEKLKDLGLLAYSEKTGYKLQSSAGQEWQRQRDSYSVIPDMLSSIVQEKLRELIGSVERPKHKGNAFRLAAFYSDNRQKQDERVQVPNELAVVTVDFRYLTNQEDRDKTQWIQASSSGSLRDRVLWVIGKLDNLQSTIRELAKSRHIVTLYHSRHQSLTREKQRLFFDEQGRQENLESTVKEAVAQAFVEGEIYFRGRSIEKQEHGNSFASILNSVGESILPDLYNRYVEAAITPGELAQLLEPQLSGPSSKFMSKGLGILELDAGRYTPTCSGEVPTRIGQYVIEENGISGDALLKHFGGAPYGYPADVVKACLVGLLRGKKIRLRPEAGAEITSVRDPGAKDMFTKDRELRRADILPPGQTLISPRDRIAICKFFKDALGVDVDRENDAIADNVFQRFPGQVRRLQELEQRYNKLPNRLELPSTLIKLRQALEKCTRSRQVEDTVVALKKNLDDLRDGIQQLGILLTDLSDENVEAVAQAMEVQNHQVNQLMQIDAVTEVEEAVTVLKEQLSSERPWKDIASLAPHLEAIKEHYRTIRLTLLEKQEQEAEGIRDRLRQRKGYSKVSEEKGSYVLTPIRNAVYDTTPEALYPSLLELQDSAQLKLKKAEQQANENLDNILSDVTNEQVIQLPLHLQGREVSTEEEVEAVVQEIRERMLAQLQGKGNVRIRLM